MRSWPRAFATHAKLVRRGFRLALLTNGAGFPAAAPVIPDHVIALVDQILGMLELPPRHGEAGVAS